MSCDQIDRLERLEGRISTIETDQAVASERWRTVDAKLDDLGAKLDRHQQSSEERSAALVDRLLTEQSAQREDRGKLALKVAGIIGTILTALAGAGGVGWWAGGGAALAVQSDGEQAPAVVDAEVTP